MHPPRDSLEQFRSSDPPLADGRSSRIKEALPDDRLDGKTPAALQGRYPRGHLSRPACSHVKQVAKRPGTRRTPAELFRPGFLLRKGDADVCVCKTSLPAGD